MPILRQTAVQDIVPRLCLIALGVAAVEPGQSSNSFPFAILMFVYLVLTIGLWTVGRRLSKESSVFARLGLDVAFVSLLVGLAHPSFFPVWTLYLLPLIGTTRAGRLPLALATGLSIAGLLFAEGLTGSLTLSVIGWPILVLIVLGLVLVLSNQAVAAEWSELRALREIKSAVDALAERIEPDDLAAIVVAHGRALVEADEAWLWWYTTNGELVPTTAVAERDTGPIAPRRLSPEIDDQLSRGPAPLALLDNTDREQYGEVWQLAQRGRRIALLALAWRRLPPATQTRHEHLRSYTTWAAGALARSQALVTAREELRRARLLGEAATMLATTLDEVTVQEVVVASAGEALARDVSCVEGHTGRVLAGTTHVAEDQLRAAIDLARSPEGTGDGVTSGARQSGLLVRSLADDVFLVVGTGGSDLLAADVVWLDALVQLAQGSLARCATYEQVRRNERYLQHVLDAMPTPVVVWNREGQLVLANPAYKTLPQDHAPSPGFLDDARDEEWVVGDPPRIFVVTRVTVGDQGLVLGHYREVTRERQALQAKDELIAVIGHELRSPLTSIHGYSQMMARQLGVVQDQVSRLNHMIADFMVAARMEGGKLPITREVVDLASLARQAADRFRGANPDWRLDLELPDQALVEGDPGRLGQVLDNLLNNAAKYSPAGQEITLTIERTPSGDDVLLAVQDHGIGIDAEYLPHLFDRFYRAPNTETQQVKGLGLGLSIVRDLIVAHGGRIWCESAGVGQGSTFRVSLPAATDAKDEPSSEVTSQSSPKD